MAIYTPRVPYWAAKEHKVGQETETVNWAFQYNFPAGYASEGGNYGYVILDSTTGKIKVGGTILDDPTQTYVVMLGLHAYVTDYVSGTLVQFEGSYVAVGTYPQDVWQAE